MAKDAAANPSPLDHPAFPDRRRRWRSGFGWLLAAVLLLGVGLPLINLFLVLHARPAVIGDGVHVASYGFDLSTFLGDRALLAAGGMPRDYLPALENPPTIRPADLPAINTELVGAQKGKFLVGSDRVIGVALGGEARAYPIRVLNWHELVNDTLGGAPIVVTYSGLCDSAAVFDRRVAGKTLHFAHSGLVYNSNLVFYDTAPAGEAGKPSLWCQLEARAIAGPYADGAELTVLPARLTSYDHWLADHPSTTIVRGNADDGVERYNTNPYDLYYLRGQLKFPVAQPGRDEARGWKTMTQALALRTTGSWHVWTLDDIAAHVGSGGAWRIDVDGATVVLHGDGAARSAWAEGLDPQRPVAILYSRGFAWHAMYTDAGVWR